MTSLSNVISQDRGKWRANGLSLKSPASQMFLLRRSSFLEVQIKSVMSRTALRFAKKPKSVIKSQILHNKFIRDQINKLNADSKSCCKSKMYSLGYFSLWNKVATSIRSPEQYNVINSLISIQKSSMINFFVIFPC